MKNVALLAYIMFVVDSVDSFVHRRTMMFTMTSTVKTIIFGRNDLDSSSLWRTVTILELPD